MDMSEMDELAASRQRPDQDLRLKVAKPISTAKAGRWHIIDTDQPGPPALPFSHCAVDLVPKNGASYGPQVLAKQHLDKLCVRCFTACETEVIEQVGQQNLPERRLGTMAGT